MFITLIRKEITSHILTLRFAVSFALVHQAFYDYMQLLEADLESAIREIERGPASAQSA